MTSLEKKKRVVGSVSKKLVATELQQERDNLNFDRNELILLYNPDKEDRALRQWFYDDVASDPKLQMSHKYYEMEPKQKQLEWYKILNYLYFRSEESRQKYFYTRPTASFIWPFAFFGQPPVAASQTMFATSVE